VRIEDLFFLLTAAHVLDHARTTIVRVGVGDAIMEIQGRSFTTQLPASGRRADDKVDLAVFVPEMEDWPALAPGDYITLDHVLRRIDARPGQIHIVAGFPRTVQPRRILEGRYSPQAITHAGASADPARLEEALVAPEWRLVVDFDKDQVETAEGTVTAPDPYGMSGCGIWYTPTLFDEPDPKPLLAGIAIEWRREHRVIVGTRALLGFAQIARQYPELQSLLDDHFRET
jgi:hypothetical protein